MKSERLLGWILLLACLTLGSCSLGKQEAKIPLTTSSDEARQLFLQGRNLLDAARPTETIFDDATARLRAAARSAWVDAISANARWANAKPASCSTACTK